MSSSGDLRRRCSGVTAAGKPCRAWAIRGTDKCSAHSDKVGAPKGNKNAQKHGAYAQPVQPITSIEDAVADVQRRLTQIGGYIDESEDREEALRALGLYGQMVSRYGRLLRDQRALSGESADSLMEVIGKALDEISTELGIKL